MMVSLPDRKPNQKSAVSKRPKGKLKIDATVADQYITYPNDLGLVNEARIKTEKMVDRLFDLLRDKMEVKPRTYRRMAHKRICRKPKRRKISCIDPQGHPCVAQLCKKEPGHIDQMLDLLEGPFPFPHKTSRN